MSQQHVNTTTHTTRNESKQFRSQTTKTHVYKIKLHTSRAKCFTHIKKNKIQRYLSFMVEAFR